MADLIKRNFQLWEFFRPSASILVRSPKLGTGPLRTLDLVFHAVRYLRLPRFLSGGIAISHARSEEVRALESDLADSVPESQIHILECKGTRHLVVAAECEIQESDRDMFESPWEVDAHSIQSDQFAGEGHRLWEYFVSHGSLLVRCPRNSGTAVNKDLIFIDTGFIGIPVHLPMLRLVEPTPAEVLEMANVLRKEISPSHVRIFEIAGGRRFPIVASILIERESESDESPFA